MLTGNLVRVRNSKNRVIPQYLDRDNGYWLEVSESLLLIFREGVGMSRGEIASEIEAVVGKGMSSLVHQGLAKVLEDRAEFEVVADVPPEELREKVFTAAAEQRKALAGSSRPGLREPFRRDEVLAAVGKELDLPPDQVVSGMFADLKDENTLLRFDGLSAIGLIDRYNVALAQAVLLRSVQLEAEVRGERPPRYRQLFRHLKFHRLLYQVKGSMASGYTFFLDGPLSLFMATNRYGLQMALFLPALLLCSDFRIDAELRWGPKRQPRTFHLGSADGLVSHYQDAGQYVPAEILAFLDRFRQLAPEWDVSEATELVDLGREGVWVPDLRFVHLPTGTDVLVEVLGFWKRSALDRLLRVLPKHGPPRYLLAISDSMKVDEGAIQGLSGPVLRFKEIPNAKEMLALLRGFLPGASQPTLLDAD
ncbi:DUF790 family protein [Tautonia plasticadhaerens]|uniref:DUF790 family protein n=1 Tax=Tautonia plasticadhaerens TaxID=2527974 RepID=A0A518GY00_9BACT|nr:DUF790 family protein [Tautonia plasticadhaerens]QDV33476.1 hypothetical protein ElP_13490 [Tautonia plasticadhaerens]